MKVAAIIQARMGSTRLPRKAMLDIEGQPMLKHVIDRVRECEHIDQVIVATTTETDDQYIADYCADNDIACFRGSNEDVLDRYYHAAEQFGSDAVVRITSDCPLIDTGLVDQLVALYLEYHNQCDGASTIIKRTFPRGLDCEVVSFETLQKLWQNVKEMRYREHVTLYMYHHIDEFNLKSIELENDLSFHRWAVDEPDDLEFVCQIYKRLYKSNPKFTYQDVLAVLAQEPDLKDINNHVQQKIY